MTYSEVRGVFFEASFLKGGGASLFYTLSDLYNVPGSQQLSDHKQFGQLQEIKARCLLSLWRRYEMCPIIPYSNTILTF